MHSLCSGIFWFCFQHVLLSNLVSLVHSLVSFYHLEYLFKWAPFTTLQTLYVFQLQALSLTCKLSLCPTFLLVISKDTFNFLKVTLFFFLRSFKTCYKTFHIWVCPCVLFLFDFSTFLTQSKKKQEEEKLSITKWTQVKTQIFGCIYLNILSLGT